MKSIILRLLLRLLLIEKLWRRYCSIGSTDFARGKMKGMGRRRPRLKEAVAWFNFFYKYLYTFAKMFYIK